MSAHKNNTLKINAIQTELFRPKEDLASFVVRNIPKEMVREKLVLAVTSKIVSLAENRVVLKSEVPSKDELVRREADHFLGSIAHGMSLTITQGLFIASAGIDESNAEEDFYILYPKDPFASAKKLWQDLRLAWNVQELGIILTDSHTTPLRRGVTGIGLSFWGFKPTEKLVGSKDLFGRPFKMTYINRVDALSAATVFVMGEGTEPRPLALVEGAAVEFSEDDHRADLMMPVEEDLYAPIYQSLLKDADARAQN